MIGDQGAQLGARNGRFEVRLSGRVVRSLPCAEVQQALLLGRVELTSDAVNLALRNRVDVAWLTLDGRFKGRLVPGDGARPALVLAQASTSGDERRRLGVAAELVAAKISSQRRLLVRARRELADDSLSAAAQAMRLLRERCSAATTVDQVRGLEGQAASLYWREFAKLVVPSGFAFRVRAYRPPPDPVNACLSLGYAVLTAACDAAVRVVGFEPSIGFLHEPARGRPSLALDVMEEFRPLVVDRVVVRLLNRRQLSADDFEAVVPDEEWIASLCGAADAPEVPEALAPPLAPRASPASQDSAPRAVHLGERGRRVLLSAIHGRLRERVTESATGKSHVIRDAILLQCRLLARVLLGEALHFTPFEAR